MKPILKISIDPGYDAFKFVIDRTLITFSSKMLDVSDEEFGVDRRADGSFYIRLEETVNNRIIDKEFLIGDATELTMHTSSFFEKNRSLLEALQASAKFKEPMFATLLRGALALALYMKESEDAQSKKKNKFTLEKLTSGYYQVMIGVALPHDYVKNSKDDVKSALKCKHDFRLYIADKDMEIPINYDLSDAMFKFDSQVKCAFIYQYTDDEGYDEPDLNDHLPCIVIDGGYHTFGHFLLTPLLTTEACKSNLTYAMSQVDTSVASQIQTKTGRTDFAPHQVKECIRSEKDIIFGKGRLKAEEIKKMHDNAIVSSAKSSIKYIEKNMDLDDAKSLLMTGGTGAAYYPTYKEIFNENFGDNLVPVLTDKPFYGQVIEPIYAVALGLYKELEVEADKLAEEEE